MLTPSAAAGVLVAWACAVAWMDLRHRRIPNVLSLGGWVLGVSHLLIVGHSPLGASASSSWLAAGLALLVTLPGYLLRQLGAGDVKFLVALGLLSSWPLTLNSFAIGALLGAVMGWVGHNRPMLLSALPIAWQAPGSWLARWGASRPAKRHIPFGACLTAGLLLGLWLTGLPAP